MVSRRHKVLVVDDSAFMRRMVSTIIEDEPTLTVVGHARDGRDAVDKVLSLQPDVVTLDVEMPGMNGFEALAEIMRVRPTPVLMVSSLTMEGADATIRCLEGGAVDFLPKPSGHVLVDTEALSRELILKIKAAAGASIGRPSTSRHMPVARFSSRTHATKPKCIFIATSTGGPRALNSVFTKLSGNLGLPIIVVQHMPAGFTRALAARLDAASAVHVVEAEDGQFLRPNTAYLAPGWTQMEVSGAGKISITDGPPVNGVRPSADVTLNSLCDTYGAGICGVVLTGMGKDGSVALKRLHDLGGWTIAEAEETCVVYGMPRAAAQCGAAELVLPLYDIPAEIARCVSGEPPRASA